MNTATEYKVFTKAKGRGARQASWHLATVRPTRAEAAERADFYRRSGASVKIVRAAAH